MRLLRKVVIKGFGTLYRKFTFYQRIITPDNMVLNSASGNILFLNSASPSSSSSFHVTDIIQTYFFPLYERSWTTRLSVRFTIVCLFNYASNHIHACNTKSLYRKSIHLDIVRIAMDSNSSVLNNPFEHTPQDSPQVFSLRTDRRAKLYTQCVSYLIKLEISFGRKPFDERGHKTR